MIVSNTTPISNFLHLGRMDILTQRFKKIHIPFAVKQEIEEFFGEHPAWKRCLNERTIIVEKIQYPDILRKFFTVLDPGEAEALCLCVQHNAPLCLLDDMQAREFAKLHNIKVTGTLGIVIEAKNRGIIDAVKPFVDKLRTEHSFWISNSMYKLVLKAAHEK